MYNVKFRPCSTIFLLSCHKSSVAARRVSGVWTSGPRRLEWSGPVSVTGATTRLFFGGAPRSSSFDLLRRAASSHDESPWGAVDSWPPGAAVLSWPPGGAVSSWFRLFRPGRGGRWRHVLRRVTWSRRWDPGDDRRREVPYQLGALCHICGGSSFDLLRRAEGVTGHLRKSHIAQAAQKRSRAC